MARPARLFTIEDANALLPELEKQLTRLIKKKEGHASRHDMILFDQIIREAEQRMDRELASDGFNAENEMQVLDQTIHEIEQSLREIRALGCIVRNLDQGWIDFPAQKDGESFYFCWHLGEKAVQYYHEAECRHSDRKLFER